MKKKSIPSKKIEGELDSLAKKFLRKLKVRSATLDIVLLKHGQMKSLKARFFKKKTEPNVISFPEPEQFPHPDTKKRHLGEIYLNEDILRRSPERTAPLLLHGILHLLGYDHIVDKDAVKMEAIEEKILGNGE